jgi:pimeloyl-ACP methyl ester carboxylesterase
MRLITLIGLLAALLGISSPVIAQSATPVAAVDPASGDFAGLVDIGGGRRLWLECRGQGGPTVILESGYPNTADVWDTLALAPGSDQTAVLPGVAAFTRVCAYDRPGTVFPPDRFSRSDPAPMPRTTADVVADLHALLDAANIPGPYVLVGHSLGGIIVRHFAATYPDEIAGLVLVDASHEEQIARFQAVLTPEQWATLQQMESSPDADSGIEQIDLEGSFAQLQEATASQPLPPLPLAVLTRGVSAADASPDVRAALPADFPWDAFDAVWQDLQDELAALAPDARHVVASKSGHYIQLEQPALVIEAIRQVVEGVRNPDTWYDLASCCAD